VIDAMEYAAYVHDTNLVILDNLQFMLSMTQRGASGGGANKGVTDRFYLMDVAVEKFRRCVGSARVCAFGC
jgi:twinkle protein